MMDLTSDQKAFVGEPNDYTRHWDILDIALDDVARYLSIQTSQPFDVCRKFVTDKYHREDQQHELGIDYLHRLRGHDREISTCFFTQFIDTVRKHQFILSPNIVAYQRPEVEKSISALFIKKNKARRAIYKKKAFAAELEGNTNEYIYNNNRQVNYKLKNNSESGAKSSPGNPSYNKTAHTALTSITRSATSYSNCAVERLLEGNRLYLSKEHVFQDILSLLRVVDYDKFHDVLLKYDLYFPKPEDAFNVIRRSTDLYWTSETWHKDIYAFLNNLSPVELAIVVYAQDLYHIRKYNENFIRKIISDIIDIDISSDRYISFEDADTLISSMNSDMRVLISVLLAKDMQGKTMRDVKNNEPDLYRKYGTVLQHVLQTIDIYSDLFKNILGVNHLPIDVYQMPNMIRRAVVGGDTDSTMFSAEHWVKWYTGSYDFSDTARYVTFTMIYFVSQMVMHILAMYSKQLGISDDMLYDFKMKSEYGFDVYLKTPKAKHYATLITVREGNILPKPKLDIKGVDLIGSDTPRFINDFLEETIMELMNTLTSNQKISVHKVFDMVAHIETFIRNEISSGKTHLYTFVEIKDKTAYKKPMISNYAHYMLWEDVFADRFNHIYTLPYTAIALPIYPIKLRKTKEITELVYTSDQRFPQDIEERLISWMIRYNKSGLIQLLVPYELCSPIPELFVDHIMADKLISNHMSGWYLFLESMGFFFNHKKHKAFLSTYTGYKDDV